jgi:hypothetical protein
VDRTSILRLGTQRSSDVVAVLVASTLMVVSGSIHLYLWDIAYRHVATLGPLFLAQTATAFVGAVILAVTRSVVVMVGAALFLVSTIGGFILAATVGLFGFTLPVVTVWAYLSLGAEALGAAILALLVSRAVRLIG